MRKLPLLLAVLLVSSFSPSLLIPVSAASPASSELAIPALDDDVPGKGPLRRYTWFNELWLKKRTA